MNERDMVLYRYWMPTVQRWGYTYDPNVPNCESLHSASELDQLRQRTIQAEERADRYACDNNELRAKLALAEQDARLGEAFRWVRDNARGIISASEVLISLVEKRANDSIAYPIAAIGASGD